MVRIFSVTILVTVLPLHTVSGPMIPEGISGATKRVHNLNKVHSEQTSSQPRQIESATCYELGSLPRH